MRIRTAIVLLTLHAHVLAQTAAPRVSPDWAAESAPPSAREQAIKEAVRAVVAEEGPAAPLERDDAFRASAAYARFERGFEESRVPGCLRPDGLKRQPTYIFGGLLALPFIAVAKARGKCN